MKKIVIINLLCLLIVSCGMLCFLPKNQNVQSVLNTRNKIVDLQPTMMLFKSLDQQIDQYIPEVYGEIPSWLNGTLLRVGPAKFETKSELVDHLFDGFAMLYSFDFAAGKVTYSNKFLDTKYYKHAMKTGEITSGFSSVNKKNIIQRIVSFLSNVLFKKDDIVYDNTNVNVTKIADHYITLTETPFVTEFVRQTLETEGQFNFDDQLAGDITTAHPHIDPTTGETFNFTTQYGKPSYYHVYKIAPESTKRNLLASVPVDNPSYMHSFALTKNFVILNQIPFTVSPLYLLVSSKSFIQNFTWNPKQGTIFTIIDRHTGKIVGNFKGAAYFTFHHVNAYQNDSSIIVDLIGYEDASVIDGFSFEKIFSDNNFEKKMNTKLLRYTIDLISAKVDCTQLSDTHIEMPRINYEKHNTQPYSYVYGIGNGGAYNRYGSSLEKIDVSLGSSIAWINNDCTAGEPIFIAHPQAQAEDDGLLLSVVLDHNQKRSFLLILDAKTLAECARAYIPHHIPFGLHGNFFA